MFSFPGKQQRWTLLLLVNKHNIFVFKALIAKNGNAFYILLIMIDTMGIMTLLFKNSIVTLMRKLKFQYVEGTGQIPVIITICFDDNF